MLIEPRAGICLGRPTNNTVHALKGIIEYDQGCCTVCPAHLTPPSPLDESCICGFIHKHIIYI